jgi:hypothetical protein
MDAEAFEADVAVIEQMACSFRLHGRGLINLKTLM